HPPYGVPASSENPNPLPIPQSWLVDAKSSSTASTLPIAASRRRRTSETHTERDDRRGRSTSSEIISGSDTRSLPVYIAIQDYTPDKAAVDEIPLEQGQIVEVLDNKNPIRWLVRTKARPPACGWVPGSYFESPAEYYKQRRQTREIEGAAKLTEEQEALLKRDQVYHDLLRSEEQFVSVLRSAVDDFIKVLDDVGVPDSVKAMRDQLAMNISELYNFHANVMLKGLQYYSDDPGKVGQTFVRLEKDFDTHVHFYQHLPETLKLLEEREDVKAFFQEFVKYSSRAHTSTKSMQKALELTLSVPQRAFDLEFLKDVQLFEGDVEKLGRLIRHEHFNVYEEFSSIPEERFVFLFPKKMVLTEKVEEGGRTVYKHGTTIRLDKYTVRPHRSEDNCLEFRPISAGLPSFRMRPRDLSTSDVTYKAWMREIADLQQQLLASDDGTTTATNTGTTPFGGGSGPGDFEDGRSEFSEYSESQSRKSSIFPGPEEGPPRKKIKSPPAISPTGSSTSIYSGGSSSIDWTTTGTTLEMQGTRVTRTQYGFRTLQESSAKMCLKVTGYPLPIITWYKDDVQLQEDERHTFYADEDGFFAMTIDPVQVSDTGRYTCMATNEYGQASTSAFFKVLKVEKEAAPPAFVGKLADQTCTEGEVIAFECEVEGWPEPELLWMVDDQPLRPSHDFKLEYDGQKAKLEIRDAQPDDTGTYKVRISNEYGTAESVAELKVDADPDKNHVAPEFQAKIEDVECAEGAEVRFKSVITGDPNPEITWCINGVPLTASEKVRMISEDGICILTIRDVTRHFDGIVTCQGQNRLGMTSCEGRLKVRVPPAPPTFNRPLEDKIVPEKGPCVFEVDVAGWPDPAVLFFLKGRELRHGEGGVEIIGHDGYYKLTFSSCSTDAHEGEVMCKASNEHGAAESRARLTVEPPEEESRSAPTFVKDIEDQTVKEGERAVFTTSVKGSPTPNITWFVNGAPINKDSPGVIEMTSTTHDHKLVIDSATYMGTVLCRAENNVGRFETSAKLTVIAAAKPKRPPRFTEELKDRRDIEACSAIFEVRVEAEPAASLEWTLNGQRLSEGEFVKIREFDGSSKLEIIGLKKEQTGELRCVARNSEGEASTSASLTVTGKPTPPEFDQKPKSTTVTRGDKAVFEAHATGEPEPGYSWSIDGRKVSALLVVMVRETLEGAVAETLPDNHTRLTVDTNVHAHSSTVSVIAENNSGMDETGVRLTIEEKPSITRELKDQTVNRGDLAHLEAVIQHATKVEWTVGGRPVDATMQGVKISQDDRFEFRLSLDTSIYSGEIRVKGVNSTGGAAESKANLTVIEPRKVTKPDFTDKLRDMDVKEGQRVEMDVIALDGENFQWSIDGKPLKDGENGVHISQDAGKSKLVIDAAKPEHSGKLTARSTNEAGTAETEARLNVAPAGFAPKITASPVSVSIKEQEDATFKITVSAEPAPRVQWSIGDKLAEQIESVNTWKSGDDFFMKITRATPNENGTVKVTAQNSCGSDSATCLLQVEEKPVKPTMDGVLQDRSVEQGEPIRWDLKLAKPDPTVKVIAENPAGAVEQTAIVQVRGKAHKPDFAQRPQNHEVIVNESVKFSAIVSGNPMPSATWFLNGTPLVNSDAIKVKPVEQDTGKTSFRIMNATLEQTGQVKCRIESAAGSVEATAELKVDKLKEFNAFCNNKNLNQVPKFTTTMDDRQVNEGDTVRFQTTVEAYPEGEVEWTLNNLPVKNIDNITTSKDDAGKYTIEIKNIRPDQAGELSCQATNAIGLKKQNATLMVKETGDAPTFAKNLEDRLVTEGDAIEMSAVLNKVKPPATVSWLKDGVELKSGDRFKISQEGDTHKLAISEAKMEDKCRITLRADNAFGSADCAASIGVTKGRPMAKPAFQSDIPTTNLAEGDSLVVKLLITGDPAPLVKWYINNQMVCQTPDTELTAVDGLYTMVIHGVSSDMSGTIKCTAYNKMGEVTTTGPLKVVAPVPVEFETTLCDATCREGDTLKLKAVLLGEPTPVVSWYVNGKKLEESQNIKIHAEKGTYTVTIKDITCDYSGKVVCEAINEFGKASSEASLLVLPRGEPPDFLEWLSNVRARAGSKVVHKVVFTGDPRPVLTWYINNKEVKDGVDGVSIRTDANTSVLTIDNFSPDAHVGEIICKAENDAGEVSCTANMVTYTSDMFSESESDAGMAEDAGMDDTTEMSERESLPDEPPQRTPTPVMAPKFITKLKDTRAKRGHSAVFECVVPDTKGVVCKWLKDGKELELIARIRVAQRTGPEGHITNELIIDDVQPEDAGKYTVVVENAAGTDVCEATLNILEALEKKGPKAPEFIIKLQDKNVKVDERAVLECKVTGTPSPKITWFHEQEEIRSSSKYTIETIDEVQRLTVIKTEKIESGSYRCVAENEAGKAETSSRLAVYTPMIAPTFTKPLSEQTAVHGEKAIFTCSVTGDPQPHVEFYCGNTRLVTSSEYAVEHDASNTHWRLVIHSTSRSSFTSYRAVATNDEGSATSEAALREKMGAPRMEQGLKAKTVKPKEQVRMEVKVAGGKPDSVKWTKDGAPVSNDYGRIKLEEKPDGTYALVIDDVKPEDAGVYAVEVKNAMGTDKSSAPLKVDVPTAAPKFTKGLEPVQVKEKQPISASVTVTGLPAPKIEWFRDGAPVAVDGLHIVVKTVGDEHTIVIDAAKTEDAGNYTAKASNPVGTDESAVPVKIEPDTSAPKFTKGLEPVEVKENQPLAASVTVAGAPAPKIEWFKDGVPVVADGTHIVVKTVGDEHSIVIDAAKKEDAGAYTVKASNPVGSAMSQASFGVVSELQPPRFLEALPFETEVKSGEQATLSVHVEGEEVEIKWMRDGICLVSTSSGRTHEVKQAPGKFSLVIDAVDETDQGTYTCTATNKAGADKTVGSLRTPKYGFEKIPDETTAPFFVEPLQETTVKEGDTVQLKCKVNPESKPTIKWFKDGQPIVAPASTIVDGVITLSIANASSKDVGKYKCEASNEKGAAQTEAPLMLSFGAQQYTQEEFSSGLSFTKLLTDQRVEIKQRLRFEAKLQGYHEQSVRMQWTKDGGRVPPEAKVCAQADGTLTLVIDDVIAGQEGAYKCTATSLIDQTTVWTEARLINPGAMRAAATGKAGPPEFVELLHSCTIEVGKVAFIRCKVTGEPRPSLKWTKDGKDIDVNRVRSDFADDGTITLSIDGVTHADSGEYRCFAENEYGSAWTEGPIVVMDVGAPRPPGEAPDFLAPVRPATVYEGETAVLEGKTCGIPAPVIKWYKNGKEIQEDDRHKIESLSDGTQRLTVARCKIEDTDEYRCEATNEYGDVWSDVTLKVNPKPAEDAVSIAGVHKAPTVLKSLEEIRIAETSKDTGEFRAEARNVAGTARTEASLKVAKTGQEEKLLSGSAPEFTKDLQPVQAKVGEPAALECRVAGVPQPEVKWFKDGDEIKPGSGVQIESLPDGTNRLKIDSAKPEDQGNYRVEATNATGAMSSKAPITVSPADTGAGLKLKRGLADQTIDKGTKIQLSVEVEGARPKTVKWYRGSEQVSSSSTTKVEQISDYEYRLEVTRSELTDSGNYRVVLSTDADSVESSCTVTVRDSAAGEEKDASKGTAQQLGGPKDPLPSFKKGLHDTAVPKGHSLVLDVEVAGNPKTVKWYKNGDEIPAHHAAVEDLGDGKYRLTIRDFQDKDVGSYSVKARNDAGEIESKANVTLADDDGKKAGDDGKTAGGEKPKIVQGLVPTSVEKGETATFTVKTAGPVKGVKWYKNGKEIEAPKTKDLGDGTYQLEIPNADDVDAADYKVAVTNDDGTADSSAALTGKDDGRDKNAPKIVQGLVPTSVDKGETATFKIKVEGPVKSVKWYKNGKEMDSPKAKDLGNSEYALEVPNADDVDAADYKVVVGNDAGNADSSAALTVKLPKAKDDGADKDDGRDKTAPKIVQGLVPTSVDKGETATFKIKVEGPVKSVKWYKNGKEMDAPKAKDLGNGEYALELPNADDVDAADYKVVVGNDAGNADSSAALTVKLPKAKDDGAGKDDGRDKTAPKIVQGLVPTSVDKGETATFKIKVEGPVKIVKWYKNGKEIPNPKAKDLGNGEYSLDVPNAQDDDAADYKVVVGNDAGDADSSAALTVKLTKAKDDGAGKDDGRDKTAPKIVEGLVPTSVDQGQTATFRVKVEGPVKTVKWYKNGKEIPDAKAKDLGNGVYSLELPNAQEDDGADYKVVLGNDAGTADSSAALTVKLPKPTFLKPLKDLEIAEGEDAVFEVETNVRVKDVKWYRNGQDIKPDARVEMRDKDTKYTMVIKKATRDDAGRIKVVLTNASGSADSEAALSVKKATAGPKIIKGLEDQVVAKGASLVFEVKIAGEPTDVKWKKDGTPLSASDKIKMEKIDDQTYRLTIPVADLADAGRYSVEASNEAGKAQSEASGEVDEKPTIVKGLEDGTVKEKDDHVFRVETSAPVRTVKWYKNGQEIKPDGHFALKQTGSKKAELTINKAMLKDGATYKVVLGNAAGDCDSSAALTVTKPDILKVLDGLKDVDVAEREPIKLTAKVQGTPKTVKWYKNGTEVTPNDKIKIEANPATGEYTLLIPAAEKSDGAAYRLELANDNGQVSTGAVAHVMVPKISKDAPACFLTPLKDTTVAEGDVLTLIAKVGGEPFPEIRWEKDGVPLSKTDRISMRQALDGTVTLRVLDVKKEDLGRYKVIAKNPLGEQASDCAVTVTDAKDEPSKPYFVIPLRAGDAHLGGRKEFAVKIRGNPKPTLEWFLNGKPLAADGDRIKVEDMGDGNFTLTIAGVREEDFGTIRCIPLGDFMSMECHVDANPGAEITWFKDGAELKSTDRLEIWNSTDGACRITITKFGQEDTGVYQCVAKNSYGVADTRANYNVEVPKVEEVVSKNEYAPRFNPPLENWVGPAGKTVTLACKVEGIPRASVSWFKDGLPVKKDDRHTVEYADDGNCSLTIRDCKDSDGGSYRCVASNPLGSTNCSSLVTIKTPRAESKKEGEEPFFTRSLAETWCDRGETLVMKCAVTGDPFPEIKWYRNSMLLKDSDKVKIETAADGTCTCTVKETTMSDEGMYRCEATNKFGSAKTQAAAHVEMALAKGDAPKLDDGQAPRFVIPLEDTTVMPGSAIELSCKVTGVPMPSVKWSKDGTVLIEDPRYETTVDAATGVHTLRAVGATTLDEGTFRCVATNESGSATTKALLTVDGFRGPLRNTDVAPTFTIKLGDTRATEGQPLKLECKVDASPLPEMVWYKDGAKIVPDDRMQISLAPDGTARLLIPCCVTDDEGMYRVIATNPSGTASDKGNAYVKKLPKERDDSAARPPSDQFEAGKAPKLLEPLQSVRIPEKDKLTLRCRFSGEPKLTIKWYKDGERVFPYGKLKITDTPDGWCELTVDSASRQDGGCYRCVAENPSGSARTTGDAVVISAPRKPISDAIDAALKPGKAPGFSTHLMTRRGKRGDTITFECVPYGDPFPTIKWMKDGIELTPDGVKIRAEEGADKTQRLIITDAQFVSEGTYRCVATNEHGTASTKAECIVEGDRMAAYKTPSGLEGPPEESKPRIRRGLHNMSIHQGSVVEMIVCVTGNPTPTVKWFKDGKELVSDGPDGKISIFTDDRGNHHLVIVNVLPEDEGEYALEATNKLGSARTEGCLNVIKPRFAGDDEGDRGGMPFPPGFVRQLKNKHVFNKLPTIFDCLVVGHPAPEVEWFHNGKRILPGGRIKIQRCGGGSHALLIVDTTVEDAGEYVAIAKNEHGTASSSAVLDVTVPYLDTIKFNNPEIEDVTPYLTEEFGFKKMDYAKLPTPPDRGPFIKEVSGHHLVLSWIPTKRSPPRYPQVTYVVEMRELPYKEWNLLDYNIPEPVCKVRNLELGKSYQFRVRAENIYGISDPSPASPPSSLSDGPSTSSMMSSSSRSRFSGRYASPYADLSKAIPSSQLKYRPSRYLGTGDRLLPTEKLMAPPRPVMDKNKKIIPLLDPYAERALECMHAEQYACAPWFAPGVNDKRFCAENDTITIILNVSGYPDPDISWKFRGWEIDTAAPTSKYRVHTYGGTETTLTITGFGKDDAGQYQCFAKNAYGDAQQNIYVDLATHPKFLAPLNDNTTPAGQPLKLDVRVEGTPFPELKWMKDWRPIVESSRVKFVKDEGGFLCSLVIQDPLWRDSGIYSCVAVNAAGQSTTSCTVTVEADEYGNPNDLPILKKHRQRRQERLRAENGIPATNGVNGTALRKVHEIYEIDEADENAFCTGCIVPILDKEKSWRFFGQLCRIDRELSRRVMRDCEFRDSSLTAPIHAVLPISDDLVIVAYEGYVFPLHPHLPAAFRNRQQSRKLEATDPANMEPANGLDPMDRDQPKSPSPMLRVADDSLLNTMSFPTPRATSPRGPGREALVRTFVRHLLKSLSALHARGIAHLDLRPETILLKDGRLVLADFGQSRKVDERGLITGECQGSPEFVSPEMVRGLPLSLATDLWSLGTLAYVLLTGISPFHGDSDNETLWNVGQANYVLIDDEWVDFSVHAQDFVRDLLQMQPKNRPTSLAALSHPWVLEGEDVPLSIDCLREFKYHNSEKWLDRRVFVLQTPSDPKMQPVEDPPSTLAEQRKAEKGERRMSSNIDPPSPVKEEEVLSPPVDFSGNPLPKLNKNLLKNITPEIIEKMARRGENEHSTIIFSVERPPPDRERPKLLPQEKGETPAQTKKFNQIPRDARDLQQNLDLSQVPVRMIRGERRDIEEEIANRILSDISEENSIAGSLASIDDFDDHRRPLPTLPERSHSPRGRGSPSETSASATTRGSGSSTPTMMMNNEKAADWPAPSPLPTDIRVDADTASALEAPFDFNRGPSDALPRHLISPPPTVASPQPAIVLRDEHGNPKEEYPYNNEGVSRRPSSFRVLSRSLTGSPSRPNELVGESRKTAKNNTVKISCLSGKLQRVLAAAEADPNIPVGAPLFIHDLKGQDVVIQLGSRTGRTSATLSPRSPRRSRAGTKSPVILSPASEHSMEVVIATKRGKPSFLPPDGSAPEIDDEEANYKDREIKAKPKTHEPEFKDDSDKREKRKAPADDLERYRPKHFYKEEDEYAPAYDIDDSPWDSHYQIGPDTYLMATRGPQFNARVRDYRRQLWGDGAGYVTQGYLGARNADVSVRERRRYTDILREKSSGAAESTVNDHANSIQRNPSATAIERIKVDITKVAPSATRKNEDGSFAPIFCSRLRDIPMVASGPAAVFECRIVGQPQPEIAWSMHEQPIEQDERHTIMYKDGIARLTITSPSPTDLGLYACEAKNTHGSDKTTARLISGDSPARSGRPDVELSSDTELYMTWEAPEGPTYLEGITYKLEFRLQTNGDPCAPWHTIADDIDDEAVVLKHLEPLGIYQFRVRAKNAFGYGEPSLNSRIVRTHQRGAPKLQVDVLRQDKRLSVVTLPQGKHGKKLEGISEESEESEAEVEKEKGWLEAGEVTLKTEDPRGRFQLESLLARGRFAVVRNAVDNKTEIGAHCACKISEATEEARREHLLLARAQNENIAHLMAAYNNNGLMYLFVERLFEDVFARFTFMDYYTEEQIALTTRQIASGLHWLHFKGIAHLSMSPHNVMFASKRSWIVRIVDLSDARLVEEKPINPVSFDQNWAPPEFYLPDATVTVQSDIWGMGVILFCLLGGFHPFTSEYDSYEEIKENVLNVKCDPNLIPVQASQEALSFVTWALKKSALRRMRTDEALSHRFLSSDPSMVRRRETIKYPSSKLRKTAYLTRKQVTNELSDKLKQASA
ncbi:hypothetical protein PENTCL1PPCAC_21080, partial [Pristionchus entomophagus]